MSSGGVTRVRALLNRIHSQNPIADAVADVAGRRPAVPRGVESRPRMTAARNVTFFRESGRDRYYQSGREIPNYMPSSFLFAGVGVLALGAGRARAEEEEEVVDVMGEGDMQDGEMREVVCGSGKVLVYRVDGKYYATSPKCPHFGAPLAKGVLSGNRVVCPWHAAAFDVMSGDLKNGPAIDGLVSYKVRVEGGRVKVTVPRTLGDQQRPPKMAARDPADKRTFVVVGAGAAGAIAAETLRQEGFTGRIVVVTNETTTPLDRTILSKNMGADPAKIALRPASFYEAHGIELLTNKRVDEVDADAKTLRCHDGTVLSYDSVLIAAGGNPRRLPVEGAWLRNVHTLRTAEDSKDIAGAAKEGTKVVVVGASFIGMEVAAALAKAKKADVTVVGVEAAPFERVLGPRVGAGVRKLFEANGVKFALGTGVEKIEGNSSQVVRRVRLADGTVLEADLVVLGAGIEPATKRITLKGIPKDADGAIPVDASMRAGKDVFAAGDVARFPYWAAADAPVRVEHWAVAEQLGRVAGAAMAGKPAAFREVPFFWSMFFMKGIRYAGHAAGGYDEVVYEGSPEELNFVAYYLKGDRVAAVATAGRDPVASGMVEAIRRGKMPAAGEIRAGRVTSEQILASLKERGCGVDGCCQLEERPKAPAPAPAP
eukprot:tig00000889_g5340.t1